MKKIAVLISGGGTNLQAIIDATLDGTIEGKVQVVISNRKDAYGLERAKNHNIKTAYIGKAIYSSLDKQNDALIDILDENSIDIVVLAGYLSILSKKVIDKYRNKIINIHPSLIPQYCGDGYYGMNVHNAVIQNNEEYSGATVHFVDEGVDTGEIILQEKVRVDEDDTPQTLAKKVLEVEHKILVSVLAKMCRS